MKKSVSYQQYINGPHSRNNGQETTEKDTAIRCSNFLNRQKKERLHTKVCGKIQFSSQKRQL